MAAMSNHENPRSGHQGRARVSVCRGERALAKLLWQRFLSFRGGACIYQGENRPDKSGDCFGIARSVWIEFWPDFNGPRRLSNPDCRGFWCPKAGFSVAQAVVTVPVAT